MDMTVLLAALRTPGPPAVDEPASPHASPLAAAIAAYAAATERKARADVEAAIARRPSTLKATLKSTTALEQARRHLAAELRLVVALTEPDEATTTLRLCS
jgi:hypothetical protein